MKIGLRHVGLIVNDAEKALTLYRDILNFVPRVDQIESDNFKKVYLNSERNFQKNNFSEVRSNHFNRLDIKT